MFWVLCSVTLLSYKNDAWDSSYHSIYLPCVLASAKCMHAIPSSPILCIWIVKPGYISIDKEGKSRVVDPINILITLILIHTTLNTTIQLISPNRLEIVLLSAVTLNGHKNARIPIKRTTSATSPFLHNYNCATTAQSQNHNDHFSNAVKTTTKSRTTAWRTAASAIHTPRHSSLIGWYCRSQDPSSEVA